MKKIILTGIISFCIMNTAFSQNASGAPAGTKIMTVAEANGLNGVVQPTINGIPYSQYKAQQNALKNQQAPQAAAPTLKVVPVTNEELQNLNKTDKQPSGNSVPAASKPVITTGKSN